MSGAVLKYTLVVRHPETHAAVALLVGEKVPGWAKDLVEPGDLEGAPEPAEDQPAGYSALKVDDLKAEIEKRNAGREDDAKLSAEGLKADLVAVLVADDAAAAAA